MLQVLCQILQTDNLADVQAWLVSTNDTGNKIKMNTVEYRLSGMNLHYRKVTIRVHTLTFIRFAIMTKIMFFKILIVKYLY